VLDRAVLFDFHGTLAQVEDSVTWVEKAAAARGVTLERDHATALADRLVEAGRAGGPPPHRVPPYLAQAWADRDLTAEAHRAAYTGLAALVECEIDGLPEALYDRIRRPEGWTAYADTAPTLAALREAGVPVAVVSNIGFDLRPICRALGLHDLITAYVLSYEIGVCKPDPAIFEHACATLGVPPEATLMVGDTAADAAAAQIGCRTHLVPAAGPGSTNNLTEVLHLSSHDLKADRIEGSR
jgi:HAD superfamily hydrolase (TIGR01509 family)